MRCQQIRNISKNNQINQIFKGRVLTKTQVQSYNYYSEEVPRWTSTFALLNYYA